MVETRRIKSGTIFTNPSNRIRLSKRKARLSVYLPPRYVPLIMNYDASNPDAELVQCAVCEKAISGGRWFSPIVRESFTVALCCPLCTETFQSNPHPYLRRIETLSLLHSSTEAFLDDEAR